MVSFEHPYFFWFVVAASIPVLLFIFFKSWRGRQMAKLGTPVNVHRLFRGYSLSRHKLKLVFLVIAIFFSVIALMNIRKGSGTELVDRKGLDVVVALDVSKSMLAEDMTPNRLLRAKMFIQQTLNKLTNDRVGLVVFAGKSYLQSPITTDYNAVNMLLESVSPDMIPTQGTVLGDAIDMSREAFNSETNKYKVLILVTDGEDHDASALEMANKARKEGVVIFTVGVGSVKGTQIIDPDTREVKTDESGNVVLSKLNEQILREIAAAGNGRYFLLHNTGKVAGDIVSAVNGMEKRNQGTVVFSEYKSYFQVFVLLALILLLIEGLVPQAKKLKNV